MKVIGPGQNFLYSLKKYLLKKISSSAFLKFLDKRNIALGSSIEILHIEDFDDSLHIGLDESNLTISMKSANNIYVTKQ